MLARVQNRNFAAVTLFAMALACATWGCPSAANFLPKSLRWFLFANFGANKICPEMLKRSVTLRLQDRSPGIGRFFPVGCNYNVDNTAETVTIHVTGTGYGYMSPAKRVGFSITTSVEYRSDFQVAGDDAYVWAKLNRIVQGPNFQLGYVENPVIDIAANLPPFGSIANFLGDQVVKGEMTRGFTVVHNMETETNEFALGILFPPNKPYRPFNVTASSRLTYANETVDIHSNQRDYLGPFEIVEGGQALFLVLSVIGPPVDVMIVNKQTGDVWREAYQTGKPMGGPPGPVLAGGPLYPGTNDTRRYPLSQGLYYVVVDNTAYAGTMSPPGSILNPFGDAVARVSYVAQLGE
jgi:hypothetical protein